MIIALDTHFPAGLFDETVTIIAELLNDLAMAWERRYLYRIRAHQAGQQLDLFDPEETLAAKGPGLTHMSRTAAGARNPHGGAGQPPFFTLK